VLQKQLLPPPILALQVDSNNDTQCGHDGPEERDKAPRDAVAGMVFRFPESVLRVMFVPWGRKRPHALSKNGGVIERNHIRHQRRDMTRDHQRQLLRVPRRRGPSAAQAEEVRGLDCRYLRADMEAGLV
jgi:hypothetical protein